MKKFAKLLLILAPWGALLLFGAYYYLAVLLSFPWVWQEVSRSASPSGACELVTYEGNRGAMSSLAYASFLVSPGSTVDPNARDGYDPILFVFRSLPRPQWDGGSKLDIVCDGGEVQHVRPYSYEFRVAIDVTGAL